MKKSKLIGAIEGGNLNNTRTWNNAPAYKSTLDANLDWFGKVGALRGKADKATALLADAFRDDALVATKILFYGRDIRGGQGERATFRAGLTWLAKNHPKVLKKNLDNIPEYGRWDDLYTLVGTSLEKDSLALLVAQLQLDLVALDAGETNVSLAGKWAASENASSAKTKELAVKTYKAWGVSPKAYRKALSRLRKAIRVVERAMSSGDWESIDYSTVPSRCMHVHNKAFKRHDETGFNKFMEKVESGEKEIKAGALYPYDLVKRCLGGSYRNTTNDRVAEAQWKALPNYLEGNEHNGLVVCDVSGSMTWTQFGNGTRPIDVSISLALYIAERNKGLFKDTLMSFSATPNLIRIADHETLATKVRRCFEGAGYNTNIQAVFDTILGEALRNDISQDEMPEVVYIVSDMAFDSPHVGGRKTNFEVIREKYKASGYKMPKLVFWNVAAADNVPIKKDDSGTALVSGCNPTIFKQILSGQTPVDVMLEVVNSERYEKISV